MQHYSLFRSLMIALLLCSGTSSFAGHFMNCHFEKSTFDSLLLQSRFQIKDEVSKEPMAGVLLKLSDPMRHGAVFTYETDSMGYVQFDIKANQKYFIQVQGEGFLPFETKMTSSELATIKRLSLRAEIPVKRLKFALAFNQLTNPVSFDVYSPIEIYQCWLHPHKQNSGQIVGSSHITYAQITTLPFLSY